MFTCINVCKALAHDVEITPMSEVINPSPFGHCKTIRQPSDIIQSIPSFPNIFDEDAVGGYS